MNKWLNNKLAKDIWEGKYQYENETVEEWMDRISGNNKEIKQLILDKKFTFAGRILANRGLDRKGMKVTLSNCYVLPQPEDSLESIFDTAKDMAKTYSYGGGCGIDLSKLAPKGAKVNNTAKSTSGAVSFMDLYDLTTGLIGIHGRRGALMLSLSVEHPDIEDFIEKKNDLNAVTKANISVKITDEFMKKVTGEIENPMYTCRFERPETKDVIEKEINAKELFKKLCKNNWDMAEPGILYWDNISNYHLMSEVESFSYAGVNPCAEEPLPPYGSCLLGSINLSAYVNDNGTFNFTEFLCDIPKIVEAMNDVLDEGLPLHPLKGQRETVRNLRQIGIGVMGIADMLIKMGIRYGSPEAIKVCDDIGFILADSTIRASALLAKDFGAFPKYTKKVLESSFLKENTTKETYELVKKYGLRNSQILTIAPTGTLSTMWGISGGIEPIFAFSYFRKTESLGQEDRYYEVFTPIVQEYMDKHNLNSKEELPDFFVNASDLTPEERVSMQAVWQKHIDASISSTVNLPNEATIEQVEELYVLAWKYKLKGLTIFRDGCKRAGILTHDNPEDNKEIEVEIKEEKKAMNCPECGLEVSMTEGCITCFSCGWGKCSL